MYHHIYAQRLPGNIFSHNMKLIPQCKLAVTKLNSSVKANFVKISSDCFLHTPKLYKTGVTEYPT